MSTDVPFSLNSVNHGDKFFHHRLSCPGKVQRIMDSFIYQNLDSFRIHRGQAERSNGGGGAIDDGDRCISNISSTSVGRNGLSIKIGSTEKGFASTMLTACIFMARADSRVEVLHLLSKG